MAGQPQVTTAQLAGQLAEGLVALSGEYQALFDQQKQLESKLSWAKQQEPRADRGQYLDLLKRFTPTSLSQDHLVFLQDIERAGAENARAHSTWIEHIHQSEDPDRRHRASTIQNALQVAEGLHAPRDTGVKIWSGPSADQASHPTQRVPSTQTHIPHMEKDFTTAGTPSKLGCPFASRSGPQSALTTPRSSFSRTSLPGRRSKRPSFNDPIRAEICGNDLTSASASVEGSVAVCPIRFLNQHAPEEVAKYFENHKHDLPRSHEVCIKRFQSNAESIEQLDRKYGNLVSMIQGLGQKHQEYLPPEPDEDLDEPDPDIKTEAKVENWAKAVTASLQASTPDEVESREHDGDDGRSPRFDRPLKEIRVGESPTRPWGVSIPAKYTNAQSSSSVGSAPTASPPLPLETHKPIEQTPQKPSKCPFDHAALGKSPDIRKTEVYQHGNIAKPAPQLPTEAQVPRAPSPKPTSCVEQATTEKSTDPKIIPQMVFNGPVFLGYPPDQLLTLLQHSNLGGTMKSG